MGARQCVVIPVIERPNGMIMTPSSTDGGYFPRVIVEGQVRYSRLVVDGTDEVWGPTLADAQERAAAQNSAWGLSSDDVLQILLGWQVARDQEDARVFCPSCHRQYDWGSGDSCRACGGDGPVSR
ncbi:hypothetical protein [Kineosporia sp. NBRC 101731]|uniref:hypothetical protein n=1 Tax=Kineosporia sp. NBRC 101731 TaxID=3032199 RepID=UPI0024A59769|nr:hypothetical protein [Kineosporia sp. NBRC 101731]GLY33132.1 hypothetical protein Kisp02_64970 [Kineosporia sp. NBRC 101731]